MIFQKEPSFCFYYLIKLTAIPLQSSCPKISSQLTSFTHLIEHPEWNYLAFNSAIHRGYRSRLSWASAAASVFSLHNETANIWTHLIGVFMTIFLGIHLHMTSPNLFIAPVYIFLVCAFVCFTTSSIYHIFIPVSRHYFPFFISLDYLGVTMMIAGCSLPHTIYAHMCRPYLVASYITLICVSTLATIFITMNPIFRTEAWAKARVALFIMFGIVCLIPLLHMILSDNTSDIRTISKLIWAVAGSNLLGAFFYASRFPESLAPGRYDFFNSHTIMHIFILIAAAIMYYSCTIHVKIYNTCQS